MSHLSELEQMISQLETGTAGQITASQNQAARLSAMAERLRQLAHAHPAPVQAHQQQSGAVTFCATPFCTHRTQGATGRDGQPICEDCREKMEGGRA